MSAIGRQLTAVAVPYQVYLLTHSSLAVGLLGLFQAVSLIGFGVYGGAIADHGDRRLVVAGAMALQGACSLVLLVQAATHPTLWILYAVSSLSAGVGTVEHAARSASIPRLLGLHRLPAAMALNQLLFQFSVVVGPTLAGVVIAFQLPLAYAIDAVAYAAAILLTLRLPPLRPLADQRPGIGLRAAGAGLSHAWRSPILLSIFGADLVAMIFGMPRALFPALADTVFHVGPGGLGLLYASIGAGALLGSLLSGGLSRVSRQGAWILWSIAAWGLAITVFGLSGVAFWLALVMLAAAGTADMVSAVFRHTILQARTPDRLRGRLSALNSVVVTAGPRLGDVESGLVATVTTPLLAVVSGGLACLVLIAAIAAWSPLRGVVAAGVAAPEATA